MLLEMIPNSVKNVSIWSDGPASQFKNRFIAAAMISLQTKHCLNIHWNFFATSHGKGPVDGIGGAVKRYVWTAVQQRKEAVVNRSSAFVEVAKNMSQVKVLEMTADDIEKRNQALKLKELFAKAEAIKGIARFHYLAIEDGHCIPSVITLDGTKTPNDIHAPADEPHTNMAEDESIQVGDWWVVEYDDELFPGEVKHIHDGNYEVSVMYRAGTTWKWPSKEDKIFYVREKLKKKLPPPTMINERDHWGASFPTF